MANEKEIAEWIKFANMDFDSAKYLLNLKPMPYEIICYHCQQTVEKYLKAFIVSCDKEIGRTHDLMELNKVCKSHDKGFGELDEKCAKLSNYAVIVRYPFHTIDLEERDVKEAILYTETIKKFVEDKLYLGST